jgi:hypothetical protein
VTSEAEFAAMGLMLSKPIICAMIHIVLDDAAFVLLNGDAETKIVVSAFFSTLVFSCSGQHVMLSSSASSS